MNPAQVLRQADILKASLQGQDQKDAQELSVVRGKLQKLYTKLLLTELEYTLDKKIELDLWNFVFKNQITDLQRRCKDRTSLKTAAAAQFSLNQLLDSASGFYFSLMQEVGHAFDVDLPFLHRARHYGALEPTKDSETNVKQPHRSSALYLLQDCLVHLGDIARYNQHATQAHTLYLHAVVLVPGSGHPYNQLSIIEAATGQKLAATYYNVRSLAVKAPFPPAYANLDKFYSKLTQNIKVGDPNSSLGTTEVVPAFLSLHALLHLGRDVAKAEQLLAKLTQNTHVMSASTTQLIQMLTINLFSVDYARGLLLHPGQTRVSKSPTDAPAPPPPPPQHLDSSFEEDLDDDILDNTVIEDKPVEVVNEEELSRDEKKSLDMLLQLTFSMLEALVVVTPKQEQRASECHTLPAIKLTLDWLYSNQDLLTHPAVKNYPGLWQYLTRLLNCLGSTTAAKTDSSKPDVPTPLPEDLELQAFRPLAAAQAELDFRGSFHQPQDKKGPSPEVAELRCRRLLQRGLWIAQNTNDMYIKVEKNSSGRLEFEAVQMEPAQEPKKPPEVVTVSASSKTGSGSQRKGRQNVAIQAIMRRNIMAASINNNNNGSVAKQPKKVTLVEPEKREETPDVLPPPPPHYGNSLPSNVAQLLRHVPQPRPAPGTRTLWEPSGDKPSDPASQQEQGGGDGRNGNFLLAQPLSDHEAAELNLRGRGIVVGGFREDGAKMMNSSEGLGGDRFPRTVQELVEQITVPHLRSHDNSHKTQFGFPPAGGPFPSVWGNGPMGGSEWSVDQASPSVYGGDNMNAVMPMNSDRLYPLPGQVLPGPSIWGPPGHSGPLWGGASFPPPQGHPLNFPPIRFPPFSNGIPPRSAFPMDQTKPAGFPQPAIEDITQVNSNTAAPRTAVGQERHRSLSSDNHNLANQEVEALMNGGLNKVNSDRSWVKNGPWAAKEGFNPACQVVGSPSLGLDKEMARITEEMRQRNFTENVNNSSQAKALPPNATFGAGPVSLNTRCSVAPPHPGPMNGGYSAGPQPHPVGTPLNPVGTPLNPVGAPPHPVGAPPHPVGGPPHPTPTGGEYSISNTNSFWSSKPAVMSETANKLGHMESINSLHGDGPSLPAPASLSNFWNKPTRPESESVLDTNRPPFSDTLSVQGLWSMGPSPLEQLIQQQRQKRISPH